MEHKRGIIFDLDGTLWDSSKEVALTWSEVLANPEFNVKVTTEDIQGVMGKTMDLIAKILMPEFSDWDRKRALTACCKAENEYLAKHGATLYPELRATMEKLKEDFHLYIVSNCQSGYIEAFLDHYKMWDLVEDIECYGNNDKPKADNIALVVERNHLTECAYVGDIQGDYDSTMEAGRILGQELSFIHAAYGFGTINAPVAKIDQFADLPAVAKTVLF